MYSSTFSLPLSPGGVGWSTPRPDRFTPQTPWNDPVSILYEAGWAPRQVYTGAENLATTGIRSADRPHRSQSLHRLRYPAYDFIYIIA